jgi:hypothetical protein
MLPNDASAMPGDASPADMPDDGSPREVPLLQVTRDGYWTNFNDCSEHPANCTSGGANEPYRAFDGTPYCTKGMTAPSDGLNYGAGLTLQFGDALSNGFNAVAAGVIGMAFDITGTSPPMLRVDLLPASPFSSLAAQPNVGRAPVAARGILLFDRVSPPINLSRIGAVTLMAEVTDQRAPFDFCMANVTMLKK